MGFVGFPNSLSEWNTVHYLRILVIVCAYLIIRPYLLKIGENIQKKQLEKQKEEDDRAAAAQAAIENEKSQTEQAPKQDWKWGQKAKSKAVRQRKVENKEISEAEAKKQGHAEQMDSDEDVSDLLQ